ncbi:hypothetical protein B0H13DRAFT_1096710 [Mycena leptocephala]|nr:hypothetical protein B0H13DRAFT_1096710 [Mycena leptocephala]
MHHQQRKTSYRLSSVATATGSLLDAGACAVRVGSPLRLRGRSPSARCIPFRVSFPPCWGCAVLQGKGCAGRGSMIVEARRSRHLFVRRGLHFLFGGLYIISLPPVYIIPTVIYFLPSLSPSPRQAFFGTSPSPSWSLLLRLVPSYLLQFVVVEAGADPRLFTGHRSPPRVHGFTQSRIPAVSRRRALPAIATWSPRRRAPYDKRGEDPYPHERVYMRRTLRARAPHRTTRKIGDGGSGARLRKRGRYGQAVRRARREDAAARGRRRVRRKGWKPQRRAGKGCRPVKHFRFLLGDSFLRYYFDLLLFIPSPPSAHPFFLYHRLSPSFQAGADHHFHTAE